MSHLTLLGAKDIENTIRRLCYQLIENHHNFTDTVIIGLQPRGVLLGRRIHHSLKEITGNNQIKYGDLDVTFYRDDFRHRSAPLVPNKTQIDFLAEGKKVVLIDDVLYTGRTIRAGMDAMLAFGRPSKVELMVLINRRYSRDLPIQPDYVGKTVDTITSDKVLVKWKETEGEDKVYLLKQEVKE